MKIKKKKKHNVKIIDKKILCDLLMKSVMS